MSLMTNRFWYVDGNEKVHTLVGCAERNYATEGKAQLTEILDCVDMDLDPCEICFSERQKKLYNSWFD